MKSPVFSALSAYLKNHKNGGSAPCIMTKFIVLVLWMCPELATSFSAAGRREQSKFVHPQHRCAAVPTNLNFESAFSTKRINREEAIAMMDETIMPQDEYGERIGWGRDSLGIEPSKPLHPSDPRLSKTYAEFPLSSFDKLLDLGMTYLAADHARQIKLLDIGSGCGRLVLYAALTRGAEFSSWNVVGVEIAHLLHESAIGFLARCKESGLFADTSPSAPKNALTFVEGDVLHNVHLLGDVDIVFSYSTAFPATTFSPELGALILESEWSSLLGQCCRHGCIAITTDKVLDPQFGWKLVDRLDVENPEVFGSTGYVHILIRE